MRKLGSWSCALQSYLRCPRAFRALPAAAWSWPPFHPCNKASRFQAAHDGPSYFCRSLCHFTIHFCCLSVTNHQSAPQATQEIRASFHVFSYSRSKSWSNQQTSTGLEWRFGEGETYISRQTRHGLRFESLQAHFMGFYSRQPPVRIPAMLTSKKWPLSRSYYQVSPHIFRSLL